MNIRKHFCFLNLLFFFLGSMSLFAQDIEYRNFDLDNKRPMTILTEEEKKEPIVIVLNQHVSELVYNKEGSLEGYNFTHIIIRLNDASQVEKLNKIYLPVSNSSDLLTLRARTTRKDGKTFDMYKGDMKQITEEGQQYLILAIEGLEEGAELEYYYLTHSGANRFFTEWLTNKNYVRELKVEIISPSNLLFDYKSYNGMPEVKDTTMRDKNFYRLEVKNAMPIEDEKYTSERAQYPRAELKMAYNTANGKTKILTFTDAAKRYYNTIHDLSKADLKAIDKLYDKMKLKKIENTEEKITTIENYMKSNFGIVESDVPYTIPEALDKKILSEGYLNQLIILLLEKAGVNLEIVLTTNKSMMAFDPSIETWNYLKELIIYFPDTKKYLSPSAVLYRYGMVPSQYTNQQGLFVKAIDIGDTKSALSSVKFIDPMPIEKNYDNMEAVITPNLTEESIGIKLQRSMEGYQAINYRPYYFYLNEEKRKELMEPVLNLGNEDAKISAQSVNNWDINTDQINKPFECSAEMIVKSLLEQAGDDYLFKLGLCIGPQAEMYQEKARKYPAYMVYPHSYKRILKVKIPEGYDVKGLDKLKMDVTLTEDNQKTAGFTSDYKVENNMIIIEVNEYYKKDTYPVAVFENYRKVINASADFNKLTILFSKKK